MVSVPVVRASIDRDWLVRAVRREPVMHAFAAWDLVWEPERVRAFSCGPERSPTGYLLIWLGDPSHPVVHWVGDPRLLASWPNTSRPVRSPWEGRSSASRSSRRREGRSGGRSSIGSLPDPLRWSPGAGIRG